MLQPEIDGMELLGLVGEGACGAVFIARDNEDSPPTLPDTEWYAVRVFNAIAVNRPLIENMVKRLGDNDLSTGAAPVIWKETKEGARCMVMPMYADVDEQKSTIATRSLQDRIHDYPARDAWPVIDKMAHALAAMHKHRIAHGNLKPGNIFFDTNDELYLTDFTMGQMPGVGILPYTDALLYAPPEQLEDPAGYLTGKGYAWDTYAFAVIAFRLLTGKFPRCEATTERFSPESKRDNTTGSESDLAVIAQQLEYHDLEDWCNEPTDMREQQRREVIRQCLSLDPEERPSDMIEVLRAWDQIDSEAKSANERDRLLRSAKLSKLLMTSSLVLAGAAVLGCILLVGLLSNQKKQRKLDRQKLEATITSLEQERDAANQDRDQATRDRNEARVSEDKARQQAAGVESSLREQLHLLGVTNDHLFEWIMRTTSAEFPELRKAEPGSNLMARELREFLKLTEADGLAGPVRARIQMQLAELEVHNKQPAAADALLDLAESSWAKAKIKESSYPARLARARLACLLQSIDQQDDPLTKKLLPKARSNIAAITGGDTTEIRRINAVMQIINGALVRKEAPDKALEHFLLALKDLEGVHKALPEHVAIRSELATRAIQSAGLADSLDMVEDAVRLRGMAASHLRWILEKNPDLKLAKVQLAQIEILSAESDMRMGDDDQGAAKLTKAEKLLTGLPLEQHGKDSAAMQMAILKGLRSVSLRDRGRTTDATASLDEAIRLMKKIVTANPGAEEPIYRLAVFHWWRSGISRNAKDELEHGEQAAALMQRLLDKGISRRDIELRRSLAYLHGELGATARGMGQSSDAISHYQRATATWQSLIDRDGSKEEYTEGLNWSRARYREAGGK